MTAMRIKMGTNGRLVVPVCLRKEIGLKDGKTVLVDVVMGEIRVRPMGDVVQQAQQRLRKYLGGEKSLSDDLIADRRAEANRE